MFLNTAVQSTPGFWIVAMPLPQPVPFQPENSEPVPASALSATRLPTGNRAWHAAPQAMPGGDDDTEPMPLPSSATVRAAVLPISVTAFANRPVT